MRTLLIETVLGRCEPFALFSQALSRWRRGVFFQLSMQSFMPAILGRFARLYPFVNDAQPHPLHGKFADSQLAD